MSNNTDASSLLGNTHIRKILESAQISINNDSLQSLSNCFMGLSGEQAEELHRTINNGATDTMKKLNLTDLKSTLTADIPDIRLQMENCMEFFKPSVDPALMETIKKAEEQISKAIPHRKSDSKSPDYVI